MSKIQLRYDFDVELIQHTGDDLVIAKAAWVSTGSDDISSRLKEGQTVEQCVEGVLKFLIKHRHGTPFEHGSLTIRVNAPIFIWREWHRHRIGFSFNEQSGRYQKLDPVFYAPGTKRYKNCIKPENWKPSKPGFRGLASSQPEHVELIESSIDHTYRQSYTTYEMLLSLGLDNGLARVVLPVGIYSACYVTCNPRSLMSFLSLRVDSEASSIPSHPQWEMHMVALQVEDVFAKIWPITHRLWNENGRVAP